MALGEVLARLGVRHVFGEALPGCADLGVHDPALARLLAEADGGVGSGLGGCFGGSVLTLTSRPGADAGKVGHASSAADVVHTVVHAQEHGVGAIALEIGFDPGDDAGAGGASTIEPRPDPSIAPRLAAPDLPTSGGPFTFDFILAGSEVIRAGAVDALRALAEETGLGVLNVFTAKGLFRWDSPYHLGTAGLQLHDFALAGLAPDRPVLAVGVGADECPAAILRDAGIAPDGVWPLTRVGVDRVASVASLVRAAHDGPPVLGELYQRLSGIAQPLYLVEDVPLNPAASGGGRGRVAARARGGHARAQHRGLVGRPHAAHHATRQRPHTRGRTARVRRRGRAPVRDRRAARGRGGGSAGRSGEPRAHRVGALTACRSRRRGVGRRGQRRVAGGSPRAISAPRSRNRA